jgi:low temperature requirement protein LtrA
MKGTSIGRPTPRTVSAVTTEQNGVASRDREDLRVSTLELFFDLVFVFTLTQLSSLLQHDLSPTGVVRVLVIFVVLFWMYGGYVWLTNHVPPEITSRRLLLICGMAAFLVCALAIPRAFAEDGLTFGIGYVFVVVIHAGLYANAFGPAVLRFVPLNLLGALCIVGAGVLEPPVKDALWVTPIALQYIASVLTRNADESARAAFNLRAGHFVERHGLLLIVAFGESVVAIGIGIGAAPLTLTTIVTAVLALLLAAALWWVYFGDDERLGEETLAAARLERRVVMALNAYFYSFIPILLGVITLAAGVKLAVGLVEARLPVEASLLLAGGVGLYLAGDVAYRLALGIRPIVYRLVGVAGSLAMTIVGVAASAVAEIVGLVAVVLIVIAVEARAAAASEPAGSTGAVRSVHPDAG